jgi:hypothetical protein
MTKGRRMRARNGSDTSNLALTWREDDWIAAFAGDDLVVIDSSRVALTL